MKRNLSALLVSLFILSAAPAKVLATVDVYLGYTYPYVEIQSGEYCLDAAKMHAEIGIPVFSALMGVFNPVLVYHQFLQEHVNINILGEKIEILSMDEDFQPHRIVYTIELDFAELAAHNGNTVSGRQKTIDAAKLAVVAAVENVEKQSWGIPGQIFVYMRNLPRQGGLTGSHVHPTTSWPYSRHSPLYQGYKAELISQYCNGGF